MNAVKMSRIDNNQLEVVVSSNKRKVCAPLPSAYANPALDLLACDDAINNTTMEVRPTKRRKRSRSCGEATTFDNTALDLGVSRAAVSEFLVKELDNVKRNLKPIEEVNEPIYANLKEVKNISSYTNDSGNVTQMTEDTPRALQQIFINNQTNLSLSFIDRLALDSPGLSSQSLYLDDDLNESNIMEIKTITIVSKKKEKPKNTNPFLNSSDEIEDVPVENPFLNMSEPMAAPVEPNVAIEVYNDTSMLEPIQENYQLPSTEMVPRRLFVSDTNSTVSTVDDLSLTNVENQNEYENIDSLRSESPVYANIDEVYAANDRYNKQSRILGQDVSCFNSRDVLNLHGRPKNDSMRSLSSNDTAESKKGSDFTHQINKLSKKVFKKLKKTFAGDKPEHNATLNPYEVPRKAPKVKPPPKEAGLENPALKLDYSDEIEEIDEDDEHLYETVKTARNTRLNMNVTPLKECNREHYDPALTLNTSGRKQVRFDSTLNQEKVITGNSFDGEVMSPGLDSKIDSFHDELENCINERKFIAQNM